MFAITTYNMPGCVTFAGAESIWSKARDLSKKDAWGPNTRPLEDARKRHKAITKHSDGSYSFDLYKTEMIRYYPDGRVGGTLHGSPSSQSFFWKMSPEGIYQRATPNGILLCLHVTNYGNDPTSEWYQCPMGKFMVAPKRYSGEWELTSESAQRTRRVVNRKTANAVRKGMKGFLEWVAVTEKLTGRSVFLTGRRHHKDIPSEVSLTLPIPPEQYGVLAENFQSLDGCKQAIYDRFGAYERVDIPNSTKPIRSSINERRDT